MKNRPTQPFTISAISSGSTEFVRNFGRFKEIAQREPVSITSHGRESLVLISAEEYIRLKSLDDRFACYPHELPNDLKEALEAAAPPKWTKKYNHEYEPE